MRDIEELRDIANKRNQTLEALLYDMLADAMNENQELKKIINNINKILNNQMNYYEFVDIVNAIEEVIKEVE